MGLFQQYQTEEVQWGIWKMEEPIDTLFSLLPDILKKSCEAEIQRFTSQTRKLEWLSVRVLFYSLVQQELQIGYSAEGKPFLIGHPAYISISHTRGYVAVILSKSSLVGIDIEQYGERVQRVANRFIRPDEKVEAYRADLIWGLLLYWSAKETIFKSMEDADADLRKLCISHFTPQEEGSFQVREDITSRNQQFTVFYHIFADFVLTWTLVK